MSLTIYSQGSNRETQPSPVSPSQQPQRVDLGSCVLLTRDDNVITVRKNPGNIGLQTEIQRLTGKDPITLSHFPDETQIRFIPPSVAILGISTENYEVDFSPVNNMVTVHCS